MTKTKGQALLPLLIIIVIVLSLGTIAVELAISNILVDRYLQESLIGYATTEAALENGLLRILRHPEYAGESLQIENSSCTITIAGNWPKTITAVCDNTQRIRKLEAEVNFVSGVLQVIHIQEIE